MKEFISSLGTTFRQEMHMKLDVMKTNVKQIEEGLTTFDRSVTSVIHALTAEGTKIKAMVDRTTLVKWYLSIDDNFKSLMYSDMDM
jgi:hypothetical protein